MPDYSTASNADISLFSTLQYNTAERLTTVTFAEGITRIGNCGFYGTNPSGKSRSVLCNVTLPSTLQSVGNYAFAHCKVLENLSFIGNAPSIASDAFYNATVTAYYPFEDQTWTSEVKKSYGGTITWRTGGTGKVREWNISLDDALSVAFYLQIAEQAVPAGQISIQIGEEETLLNISELSPNIDGYYVVTQKVPAAQMNDQIVIQVIDGESASQPQSFSVRRYCDTILEEESYSQYHQLVKALLNYGAMAQIYFGNNTQNLANNGITGTENVEVPKTVEEIKYIDNIPGLSLYGVKLVYRDRIAVRYYFEGDVTDCTFTANGLSYAIVAKDGMYYMEVADILPQDLDQPITLTVTDGKGNTLLVTYNPMDYIVRMREKGSQKLCDLLKALYNYHLAAKAL